MDQGWQAIYYPTWSEKRRHHFLNTAKPKILETCTFQTPTVIQVDDVFLEILVGDDVHKCFATILTGIAQPRANGSCPSAESMLGKTSPACRHLVEQTYTFTIAAEIAQWLGIQT